MGLRRSVIHGILLGFPFLPYIFTEQYTEQTTLVERLILSIFN